MNEAIERTTRLLVLELPSVPVTVPGCAVRTQGCHKQNRHSHQQISQVLTSVVSSLEISLHQSWGYTAMPQARYAPGPLRLVPLCPKLTMPQARYTPGHRGTGHCGTRQSGPRTRRADPGTGGGGGGRYLELSIAMNRILLRYFSNCIFHIR